MSVVQPIMIYAPDASQNQKWNVELFEVGDWKKCLYSYCCCPCALGSARNGMDGSDWCTSCVLMNPSLLRWMVRTAYGLEGSPQEDCWYGLCCSCCVINQALQTVETRGRPNIPDVGPEYYINNRIGVTSRANNDLIYDGCYSCLCPMCSTGIAMQAVGMPWWFGMLCVHPYSANSVLRAHYRIRPGCKSEFWYDACIPVSASLLGGSVDALTVRGYTFFTLAEANARTGRTGWYGIDICGACSEGIDYCRDGCVCNTPEGRYLHHQVQEAVLVHATAPPIYNVVSQNDEFHHL